MEGNLIKENAENCAWSTLCAARGNRGRKEWKRHGGENELWRGTPFAWKVNEPLKESEMLVTPSSSLAFPFFSPMYI